ncbi:hypothetical protein OIU85_000923 [Salix viminalis]|uniref:Uncharacterized protein n=1 Tax=Salix viminalis TaxID=40686 RepID=A0A9Q0VMN8_SALVM|nr:hypothetical protein OIU85_000923 [Salix viminalis]
MSHFSLPLSLHRRIFKSTSYLFLDLFYLSVEESNRCHRSPKDFCSALQFLLLLPLLLIQRLRKTLKRLNLMEMKRLGIQSIKMIKIMLEEQCGVGPISWLSFLFLAATGAGLIWYYDRMKKQRIEAINKSSAIVKVGPSAGKPEIGDELQKLAAAIDKIKEKAGFDIVPVFITVDPERDNVEQVREYVKEFHPKLIGLTGSLEEIKRTARAYRIYYMKTSEEDSDYLVDHSIIIYLMDPNMELVKFFGKNNDADALADGVIKEMKQYKSTKSYIIVIVSLQLSYFLWIFSVVLEFVHLEHLEISPVGFPPHNTWSFAKSR